MRSLNRILSILRYGTSQIFYSDVDLWTSDQRDAFRCVDRGDIFIRWDLYYFNLTLRYSCQNWADRFALWLTVFLRTLRHYFLSLFYRYYLQPENDVADKWRRIILDDRRDLGIGNLSGVSLRRKFSLNFRTLLTFPRSINVSALYCNILNREILMMEHLTLPDRLEIIEFADFRYRALVLLAIQTNTLYRIVYLASAVSFLPKKLSLEDQKGFFADLNIEVPSPQPNDVVEIRSEGLQKELTNKKILIVTPTFPNAEQVLQWTKSVSEVCNKGADFSVHPSYSRVHKSVRDFLCSVGFNETTARDPGHRMKEYDIFIGAASTLLDLADSSPSVRSLRIAFNDYQLDAICGLSSSCEITRVVK